MCKSFSPQEQAELREKLSDIDSALDPWEENASAATRRSYDMIRQLAKVLAECIDRLTDDHYGEY